MKKLLATLILTILLNACGNTAVEETKNDKTGTSVSDPETSQTSPYLNAQDEN